MLRYNIRTGVRKIKTKTALMISGATLGFAGLVAAIAIPLGAHAASPVWVAPAPAPLGGGSCASPDFNTISAAVAAAGSGDIINVCPGTYTENVTIPVALTLSGANAGTDGASARGTESVVNGSFTVNADNVKIDGFSVNDPAGSSAFMMQGSNTGEIVTNNIIDNEGYAVNFRTSSTTVSHNKIVHGASAITGVEANSNPGNNLTFDHNTFSGIDTIPADITVIGNSSPQTNNVTVTNNASTSGTTLIALFNTDIASISGNTYNGDSTSSAIYLGGADSNIAVSGNTVNSASTGVNIANDFGDGANSSVNITNNILHANTNGVKIGTTAVSTPNTVTANRNQLTSNTAFGVNNLSVFQADATCNWWGAINGPGPVGSGTGDKVTSNVTFSPWLVTSDLNGRCIGGNIATNKDQCKDGGWLTRVDGNNRPFKNQGDCVSFVATGGKNKANG